jgi:outer membrane immunogenic protein
VSKVQAKGEVQGLKKVEDFEGMYAAVAAGGAMGSGRGAAVLENQKGVQMVLTATAEGVRFTTAPGGLEITLKK